MRLKFLVNGSLILLILGVLSILFSFPSFMNSMELRNDRLETVATITEIGQTRGTRRTTGTPFANVRYAIDGVDYSSRVYFRPAGALSVGEEVQIYYSPRNPNNVRLVNSDRARSSSNSFLFPLIFGGGFIVLYVLGVCLNVRKWKHGKSQS